MKHDFSVGIVLISELVADSRLEFKLVLGPTFAKPAPGAHFKFSLHWISLPARIEIGAYSGQYTAANAIERKSSFNESLSVYISIIALKMNS